MIRITQGSILLLNGVSSSGKSAIIKNLSKSNADLKILNVDDWFPEVLRRKAIEFGWKEELSIDPWFYFYDYVTKETGKYYFNTEIRQNFFNNSFEFYQKAKDFAAIGDNVIIDTVLEYEKEYKKFDEFFKNIPTKKILIYCSMDILLRRVEQRNKSGIAAEQRTAFQSFEQFPAIYKIQENLTEPLVDSIKSSVMKHALDRAIQELIDNNIPEPYLPKLQEFKKKFIKEFRLNEQDIIFLAPKHSYNLILNSSESSPQELAKEIMLIINECG